jgi:hypothetical protein
MHHESCSVVGKRPGFLEDTNSTMYHIVDLCDIPLDQVILGSVPSEEYNTFPLIRNNMHAITATIISREWDIADGSRTSMASKKIIMLQWHTTLAIFNRTVDYGG